MTATSEIELISADRKRVPSGKLTYDEFLAWADDKTHAEWVNGEIEIMSPAAEDHQDIAGFLAALIRARAEQFQAGRVITAPFQMRLQNLARGREPDILFVIRANESRIRRAFLDGPCDLAIEIVSPESALRDRGAKYAEYEYAGIPEYWIIDPVVMRTDFFVLSDGRYERRHADAEGVIRSAVFPEFWIKEAWLWAKPMPTLISIMRQWTDSPEGNARL